MSFELRDLKDTVASLPLSESEALVVSTTKLALEENAEAVQALANICEVEDISLAVLAAHGLGRCAKKGHDVALDSIAALLAVARPQVKSELVHSLSQSANRGFEHAILILEASWKLLGPAESLDALEGLCAAAGKGNPRSIQILKSKWLDEGIDENIRKSAGSGLVKAAERGHEAALAILFERCEDTSDIVGEVALHGLAGAASRKGHPKACEVIHKRLGDLNPRVRKIAEDALTAAAFECHLSALNVLIFELDQPEGDHIFACKALGVAAREGYEEAIAELGSRVLTTTLSSEAKLEAVKGLAGGAAGTDEGGSERAVDVLFGLLSESSTEIRHVVIDGLSAAAGRGHETAAQVLIEELKLDEKSSHLPEDSRVAIVRGLTTAAANGNERVLEPLFRLMNDKHEEIRQLALLGMEAGVARNSDTALSLLLSAEHIKEIELHIPETIEEDSETGTPCVTAE